RAPGETFWVTVRGGRVEVRGTRFTVRSEGDGPGAGAGPTVEVEEGRVLVRDDGGRELLVGGGERADLPLAGAAGDAAGDGGGPARPAPASSAPSKPRPPAPCAKRRWAARWRAPRPPGTRRAPPSWPRGTSGSFRAA